MIIAIQIQKAKAMVATAAAPNINDPVEVELVELVALLALTMVDAMVALAAEVPLMKARMKAMTRMAENLI